MLEKAVILSYIHLYIEEPTIPVGVRFGCILGTSTVWKKLKRRNLVCFDVIGTHTEVHAKYQNLICTMYGNMFFEVPMLLVVATHRDIRFCVIRFSLKCYTSIGDSRLVKRVWNGA